jgi:hypothetical protein
MLLYLTKFSYGTILYKHINIKEEDIGRMKMVKAIVKTLALSVLITTLTTSLVFAEDKIVGDELIGFETEGTSYTAPVGVTAITRTMDSSFWGPNLKTLNTSKGLKEIGHFTFHYDYDTPLLETINMEDVEIIGDFAFGGLKNLSDVNTASELKEIRSAAFTNCTQLKSIDLQNLEILGNQAFEGAGLVEVTVPGTVKKVEFQAFNLMPSLEKVTVEEGVEELEKYSFQSYKFKEIHLPASLTKIDDFAIGGNTSGVLIYVPSGSYAEDWARRKGFRVSTEGTSTPVITTPTTNIPNDSNISVEMTPFNYTDLKVINNTEWGLGKSKNVVKVAEENVVFYNNPSISGLYQVETWNKNSYATRKYNFNDYDYCYQYIYVKKDGELHLAYSNTEGPFENRIEIVRDYVPQVSMFAGVLVPRPSFEAYLPGVQPVKPATDERWTEKDVGEVYILIDYKYSNDKNMIDVKSGKRLIKLDLSTGTYPEPLKKEPIKYAEMTKENYNVPDIMITAEKGLSETRDAVSVEKEYLNFNEDSIDFKDGIWDVETWNKDTYATSLYADNLEKLFISYIPFVKINGELYTASSDESTEKKSFAIYTAPGDKTRSGITEVLESEVIKMNPQFSVWKYNYANPFDLGKERWTENNVGEVYVGIFINYGRYEFKFGPQKDVLMPQGFNYEYKMIKLDMSGSSPTTPTTPTIETVTALPTSSPILVNGKRVEFEAYNINGNNYFKLRDIALALSGTNEFKQFSVNWDASKNAINLTTGGVYSPVGGELVKGDEKTKAGTTTTSQIYKDGELLTISGYNINNNNYFKLRDIGKAFLIGIDWDDDTQTVVIDTSRIYTED